MNTPTTLTPEQIREHGRMLDRQKAASELAASETAGPAKVVAAVATGSALARRMEYNIETTIRFHEVKTKLSSAKHEERMSRPDSAVNYLEELICEARKLQLHLRAWGEYKPSSPNT